MGYRLESTSGGPLGSSFGGSAIPLSEGSAAPPADAPSREGLPERYGRPQLELLVVDPRFVFIAWEITPDQLDEARSVMGDAYDRRRLAVRFHSAGDRLAERSLYGELGRWFVDLNAPGQVVTAELGYDHPAGWHSLLNAGPVELPRDAPLEPTEWVELHVAYGTGPTGELTLESSQPDPAAALPVHLARPPGSAQARPGVGSTSSAASSGGASPELWPVLPEAGR